MNFLKRRKNKKFNYNPRHYKGKKNPHEIYHMFDDYRHTAHHSGGLIGKWYSAMFDSKTEGDRYVWMRLAAIVAVLLLVALYILDFDLTIFFD
jgi:hypothetical protein